MDKNKIKHVINVIGLLLCITLSFAWMMEIDTPTGRYVDFNFNNNVYIAPNDLDVKLFCVENGVEQDITKVYQANGESAFFTAQNFAPGDYKMFIIRLKNKTDLDMSMAINFSNISASSSDFYEYMNIGIASTKGFVSPYLPPTIEDFYVADRLSGNAISFINKLTIPPNSTEVEIKFYVMLSRKATNTVQGKEFKIGTLNFITA